MENKIIKNELVGLNRLEETIGNPQKMTENEFNGLVESIKKKGFILDDPVIWEYEKGKYKIISGHHRIKAAIQAGYKELNCKIISGLNEKEARLLVIEANKRRGKLDGIELERYIQDIMVDFNDITLDFINKDIGIDFEDIFISDSKETKESESLKFSFTFKSIEEKEQFIDILDYYGGRGRSISDKIKQFVGIMLRNQKKKEEKEEKIVDKIE